MSYYGYTITAKGRSLIAKLLAGDIMTITKVIFGSGRIPDSMDPREVTELFAPEALGAYSRPAAADGVVSMTVEYRSDLNGGLEVGFDLREFGIYAMDPDEGEVLIYYATLGDHPQWVSPYLPESEYAIDVRRFPVTIKIGDDRGVQALYDTELWMTEEDVYNYYMTVLLPIADDLIRKRIAEHNADEKAHPPLRKAIDGLAGRIRLLELQLGTNVTGNPFLVTFEDLDGVVLDGTWNRELARVEF